MQPSDVVHRVAGIKAIIPVPPTDIAPLRIAFSNMVSKHWEIHVPPGLVNASPGITHAESVKIRFMAEMYARACYSMLLVSAGSPAALRLIMRGNAVLPLSRNLLVRLGSALLANLNWLTPQRLHRQLIWMSALMGLLDVVLDKTAYLGEAAVLRIASLITQQVPRELGAAEQPITSLAEIMRSSENSWQSKYWETVLQPAVREYCLAEALAVAHASDPTGMSHRGAGINTAIKGMWYAVGPYMGLEGSLSRVERSEWNREQQWMADASLLMQMIDDWADQDEDHGARATPVIDGGWNLQSVDNLYRKTVRDLTAMLTENQIRNHVLQELFLDLYNDYLQVALQAMCSGIAA